MSKLSKRANRYRQTDRPYKYRKTSILTMITIFMRASILKNQNKIYLILQKLTLLIVHT